MEIKNETINKAIEYIYCHIDKKMTVDEIAKHCNFSKYHFSRLFKQEMGESVYSFIKRNKIVISATSIKANPNRSITDIGYDCGYSPSNYAVAFKDELHISPIEYKKSRNADRLYIEHPFFDVGKKKLKTFEEYASNIKIKEIPDFYIHYRRFLGGYNELKELWNSFIEENLQYKTDKSKWLEISYSDPDLVSNNQCLCDVSITVEEDSPLSPKRKVNGGKFAVYHLNGHLSEIFTTYQGLTCIWLPKSGYTLGTGELFDKINYIDSENNHIDLDIFIPIA